MVNIYREALFIIKIGINYEKFKYSIDKAYKSKDTNTINKL